MVLHNVSLIVLSKTYKVQKSFSKVHAFAIDCTIYTTQNQPLRSG
jgi:hypothetical protein